MTKSISYLDPYRNMHYLHLIIQLQGKTGERIWKNEVKQTRKVDLRKEEISSTVAVGETYTAIIYIYIYMHYNHMFICSMTYYRLEKINWDSSVFLAVGTYISA